MLRWLKKHFIPHKANDFHPHVLRTDAFIFFLAVIAFIEGAFLVSTLIIIPNGGLFSAILPNILIEKANAARSELHEQTLTVNPILEEAARLKAQDMVAHSYFAHTSPSGVTPWHWLAKAGYRYTSAGENLAVDFIDASDVHTAWMASPTHRANIVNDTYTEIGIATATGMYQGHETVFVVQFFGKPKRSVSVSPPPVAPSAQHEVKTVSVVVPTDNPPEATQEVFPSAKPTRVQVVPMQQGNSSALSMIVAEPRTSANSVMIMIASAIIFALALTVIIRKEFPHPQIMLKPLLLLFIVLSLAIFNRYIGLAHLQLL